MKPLTLMTCYDDYDYDAEFDDNDPEFNKDYLIDGKYPFITNVLFADHERFYCESTFLDGPEFSLSFTKEEAIIFRDKLNEFIGK